jgi:8-oxo-dGTP diphosphatase
MLEQRIAVVVIGLIKDSQGRVFLQKRRDLLIPDADGMWEMPGGRIEFGESPEEALQRECVEEIGCEVSIKRLIPLVQSKRWSRTDGVDMHVIVLCYEADIVSGIPEPSDDKVSEVGWFTEDKFRELELLRGTEEFITYLDSREKST